jgi:signal transduction histidine kinase
VPVDGDGICASAARDGRTRVVTSRIASGPPDRQDAATADEIEVAVATPLRVAGQVFGVLGLAFAASRRMLLEDPLYVEALAAQITLTLVSSRSLSQSEWVKNELLSVAGHELYTPLTPLKGFIQLMSQMVERATPDAPLDHARLWRYLQLVESRLDHLTRLVHAMLDLSTLQQGILMLTPSEVDIVAIAGEVLASFESITSKPTGVRHALLLDAPAPVVACCDAQRIDQVFTNLVSNAIKYSPGGGSVLVRVHRDGDNAVISVEDEGIGITAPQAERLFQPFVRGTDSAFLSIPGVGLGLYICHEIVRRHGGSITAGPRQQAGAHLGTVVRITLPLAGPDVAGQSP